LAADERYFAGVAAVLTSLAAHAELDQHHGRVILLRPGPRCLSESDSVLLRLAERLGLGFELRPISPRNHRLPDRWVRVPHFRVLDIPDACHDVDRAVYLDADVLVRSSLRELFAIDLAGKSTAAAADLPEHPTVGTLGVLPGRPERERFSSHPYINSGVVVLDLRAWRADQVSRRAEEFVVRHPESIRYLDQDALTSNTVQISWPAVL